MMGKFMKITRFADDWIAIHSDVFYMDCGLCHVCRLDR